MYKNYLKIAFRNLLKQKTYSVINIVGLTIGMTCCLLIVLFVLDELSYDTHYEKAEQIYRVAVKSRFGNQDLDEAVTSELMAGTLVREYPEVLQATRIVPTPNMLVRYQDKTFNETQFLWVDSTFFDVFPVRMLYGDMKTALKDHHTVVMTRATAEKYFSNLADAVGKIVNYEDGTPYRISGIIENAPVNSHFHYGMLCPLSSWEWKYPGFWLAHYMYTYIVLQKDCSPRQLEAKFPSLIEKFVAPHIERRTKMTLAQFYQSGGKIEFYLQPLTSIHLHSHISRELEPNSDIKYVYIISFVALFILLLACINFMNLSTAKSCTRSREIGVRKAIGSFKSQLVYQFLLESVLFAAVALMGSLICVKLLLPCFNNLAGKQLTFAYFSHWFFAPVLLVVVLVVGVLAGSYPAFYLASFKPIEVLKKSSTRGTSGNSHMRSALVVFQFAISIALLVGTFIVYQQLRYIQNKRLGFDKENILVIKRGWAVGQNADGTPQAPIGPATVFDVFKTDLLQNPNIISIAGISNLPGKDFEDFVGVADGGSHGERLQFNILNGDFNFAETMKFELLEGRFFSPQIASDTVAVVINEAAGKLLGYERPYVGKRIGFPNDANFFVPIIGVVQDFHYESLYHNIAPMVLVLQRQSRTYIAVRIHPQNVMATVAFIEKIWNKFIPNKPFEYFFFDVEYDKLYNTEKRIGKLFTAFSALAIAIACLGLLGLASFTIEQRTKETGIRRVLGASMVQLTIKLSKEFIRWVIAANLIAWPVAWYVMNRWLQNFAYRIDTSWWMFALAGGLALIIAIGTIGWQTIRAARTNPVEALRCE